MRSHTANLLKSVGMEVFMTFFDEWDSPQIDAKLKASRGYTDKAVATRVSKARRIRSTREGTTEALGRIRASANADASTVAAAKARLESGNY